LYNSLNVNTLPPLKGGATINATYKEAFTSIAMLFRFQSGAHALLRQGAPSSVEDTTLAALLQLAADCARAQKDSTPAALRKL